MPSPCLLVTIVPQLTLYSNSEVKFILNPLKHGKQVAFLPLVIGISLTASAASAGLSGRALGHSLWAVKDINSKLKGALFSTAESLTSLQKQVTSLAQVTLQNRRALDLLTTEKGGNCLFLREECCYYINESGLVEDNVVKLTDLAATLRTPTSQNLFSSLMSTPLLAWVWPILGPLCVIFLMCLFLPCIIKFIQTQVGKISNQTFNQFLLRNYQLLATENQPPSPENIPLNAEKPFKGSWDTFLRAISDDAWLVPAVETYTDWTEVIIDLWLQGILCDVTSDLIPIFAALLWGLLTSLLQTPSLAMPPLSRK
ncbi:endogenous retrovirus group FC1 Env polyprotein-like [Marmota monax]|uniref:endogenous retrovirus group FC1 Env polyprotein-like n=1 Tax=Marmota monax TaxID=9995 RepID=UPI001EAF923A|nr:endogenous retrovirus group FC1 Env polyprotein-like [Marmota monax]XP_048642784.1 endogenous retrovirus group FC1 Env polyprotein-like [Marmota marmota marmota]XP_058431754.1 endogenous retrovirus group FC1 Env polyprotein-like [Marmota monax]